MLRGFSARPTSIVSFLAMQIQLKVPRWNQHWYRIHAAETGAVRSSADGGSVIHEHQINRRSLTWKGICLHAQIWEDGGREDEGIWEQMAPNTNCDRSCCESLHSTDWVTDRGVSEAHSERTMDSETVCSGGGSSSTTMKTSKNRRKKSWEGALCPSY